MRFLRGVIAAYEGLTAFLGVIFFLAFRVQGLQFRAGFVGEGAELCVVLCWGRAGLMMIKILPLASHEPEPLHETPNFPRPESDQCQHPESGPKRKSFQKA